MSITILVSRVSELVEWGPVAPRASVVIHRSAVRVFTHLALFPVLPLGHSRLLASPSGCFLPPCFLPEGDR